MKLNNKIIQFALAGAMALGIAGNAMAGDRTTNTLLGAGLGAAAGAVLSQGDPLLTLGGAAAGGVLGNVLTEDNNWRGGHRHYRERSWNRPHGKYVSKHYRGNNHHHFRGRGPHRHHR